jgi:DNA-binding NarL/FixJ family response regulator
MTDIRILIADNHELCARLRPLIEAQPDMEVAGEASDGAAALLTAKSTRPDIALIASNLPGPGLLDVIVELRRVAPGAGIIVLTTHEDRAHVIAALQAGAMGYVARAADITELISAIHAVRAGRTFFDSTLSPDAPAGPSSEPRTLETDLSARELETLRLLAKGHSNQEIATQCRLSVKTIETYRHRINVKLGLSTRAELYQFALSHGLLRRDADQA